MRRVRGTNPVRQCASGGRLVTRGRALPARVRSCSRTDMMWQAVLSSKAPESRSICFTFGSKKEEGRERREELKTEGQRG